MLLRISALLLFVVIAPSARAADVFAPDNLVAWCIVPFDAKKRTPEQRAEMLQRLGIRRFAYDWRDEHLPTFDAELTELKERNIELTAVWFPASLNDQARVLLDGIRKHKLNPQLWVMSNVDSVDAGVAAIGPVAREAAKLNCKVALYNHGGWFGEPENQIAIIERLKSDGVANVGIVYNQHHGHAHVDRFPELLAKMKPHLLALNLNGMTRGGDNAGKKILPIGDGELDASLLKTIHDGGYDGPIGILNHTDEDAETRLRANLAGLAQLAAQLNGAARLDLRTGHAQHAFDHLGSIGEQADAAADSGATVIYATGCGGLGYEGLPPAAQLADAARRSSDYNRAARAKGIRVILGYVCATSIVNLERFDKHWPDDFRKQFETPPADWRQQGADGKPLPSWYGGQYQPACMNNPDWRAYERFMVRQQLDSGHDGIFFDNPTVHPQGCYCPHCMTGFVDLLKREGMTDGAGGVTTEQARQLAAKHPKLFLRFRGGIARDFMREMRDYARTIRPDALVTCNNSLNSPGVLFSQARTYGYNIHEMSRVEDLVVVEDMATQPRLVPGGGGTREYGPTLTLLHAISRGKPVVANVLADGDYHTAPNLMRLAIAEAAAHDASYLAWPTWPEPQRQRMIDAVKPQAEFLRKHAGLLAGTKPRRDVTLFLPFRQWLQTDRCAALDLATTLRASSIQFAAVSEDDLLGLLEGPDRRGPVFLVESESVLTPAETAAFNNRKRGEIAVVAADQGNWLERLRGFVKPVELRPPAHLRAVVRDHPERTVVHVYNLAVERVSSFEDKVHPATDTSISFTARFPKVRSVKVLSADDGATTGPIPFEAQANGDETTVSVVLPKLVVSSILVVEP